MTTKDKRNKNFVCWNCRESKSRCKEDACCIDYHTVGEFCKSAACIAIHQVVAAERLQTGANFKDAIPSHFVHNFQHGEVQIDLPIHLRFSGSYFLYYQSHKFATCDYFGAFFSSAKLANLKAVPRQVLNRSYWSVLSKNLS